MLGPVNSNSEEPIATIFSYDTQDLCCQGMHRICSGDQTMNDDIINFSSRWKYE